MRSSAIARDRLHLEEALEVHMTHQLVTRQGWEERPAAAYDRALALDPGALEAFVRETQPEAWRQLEATYPGRASETLATQVSRKLEAVGTLEVLRRGLTIVPRIEVRLCSFRPASSLNPELVRLWGLNRLTVMRQVRYSLSCENAIDVVLLVNGIPVATFELKNTMTGSSRADAEAQWRRDRPTAREPLLTFRRGALVHFAADQDAISMTTLLENGRTRFLPFDRGRTDASGAVGAGNDDVEGDFRISHLWRDMAAPDGRMRRAVLSRDVLLEIIDRLLLIQEVELPGGRRKRVTVWPRYHQLDAVRALLSDARTRGPGRNYLFQHSAGSGKSNTIAWAAHGLATLHDEADRRVFDTVIVVTDRVVLDRQLQATVEAFSRTPGYVQAIDGTSRQLREALRTGAKIVISTIHKFSTEAMSSLGNDAGRRFAVLVDEAHGSQSGRHADSLARALADQTDPAPAPAGRDASDALEARLLEIQRARGPQANVSYLAFTATPRNVTLERFGDRGAAGLPRPFHLYAMRQAIEEGFILDVLGNYRTYASYAALEKAVEDDPRLQGRTARRRVARFVDLHETAMDQKAEVVVEHFRRHALPLLDGQAKAMVVTASREHAVRTRDAIAAYARREGHDDLRALVAFSGEIAVDGERVTESGINGFAETELPARFDGPEWNVLVVAEKYQTGFDQPKLVAMYVDRKLDGLQAVQTLSRLNRTHPGKQEVFVLDFRNTAGDIREAFRPYFNASTMEEVSDANRIYDLEAQLMASAVLNRDEVERFARLFLGSRNRADERPVLEGLVRQSVARFAAQGDEGAQEEFRQTLASFLRFYAFVTQVVRLDDPWLEALQLHGQWLKRLLPARDRPAGDEVTDEMLELHAYRLEDRGVTDARLEPDASAPLAPIDRFGANPLTAEEAEALSEIIAAFNARHGANFTEEDFVRFEAVREDMVADEDMAAMLRNNAPEVARPRFDAEFMRRAVQAFQRDRAMQGAFLQDREAREMLMALMFQRAMRRADGAA